MDIYSLAPEELASSCGLSPRFRGTQLFRGIQKELASSYDQITTLPLALRTRLSAEHPLDTYSVERELSDPDGTRKLLIRFPDGLGVESVLLKDEHGRATGCISTQVGCAMGCRFCKTARMGLKRNLTAGEIVLQALALSRMYGALDNIVFMGMGEPLANFEAFSRAVAILSHPEGLGLGHRRMTVSTAGVVPGILRLAEEGPPVRLAVSLTAADDEKRKSLMPVDVSYPLPRLREALLCYQKRARKRITLEWVLLGGINSGDEDAKGLIGFVRGLSAVVNVIPWNKVPEIPFEEPAREETERFVSLLEGAGIAVTRRYRRGKGINGACGQLAT